MIFGPILLCFEILWDLSISRNTELLSLPNENGSFFNAQSRVIHSSQSGFAIYWYNKIVRHFYSTSRKVQTCGESVAKA